MTRRKALLRTAALAGALLAQSTVIDEAVAGGDPLSFSKLASICTTTYQMNYLVGVVGSPGEYSYALLTQLETTTPTGSNTTSCTEVQTNGPVEPMVGLWGDGRKRLRPGGCANPSSCSRSSSVGG